MALFATESRILCNLENWSYSWETKRKAKPKKQCWFDTAEKLKVSNDLLLLIGWFDGIGLTDFDATKMMR